MAARPDRPAEHYYPSSPCRGSKLVEPPGGQIQFSPGKKSEVGGVPPSKVPTVLTPSASERPDAARFPVQLSRSVASRGGASLSCLC